MLLTVAFVLRVEEPYPAIYQPAFQYASPVTTQVYTQVADITAHTADGESVSLEYEDLFRFAPDNRDVFLFRMMPDSVPTSPVRTSAPSSWRKRLKKALIADYQDAMLEKRAHEYAAWLASLEDLAEAQTGQDLVSLELTLYDVTYYLLTGETEQQLKATKHIRF